MAENILRLPYDYYFSPSTNKPIALGKVYIGIAGLNPKIFANRKSVTLRQEDGTNVVIQPSGQPLRTGGGGGVLFNGSPVEVLVEGDYSIRVDDNQDSQVYFFSDVLDGAPVTTDQVYMRYATLAAMIADTTLSAGDGVIIEGRITSGDGGGATYLIAASQSVDEFGDHTLSNGNVALLQIESATLVAKQYGVVGDAVADDTDANRALAARFQLEGGGTLDFADLRMNVLSTDNDTVPLFDLSGIDGITLRSAGAEFIITGDYTAVAQPFDRVSVFRFVSCDNIYSQSFKGSITGSRGSIFDGGILFEMDSAGAVAGCNNFTSELIDLTDWSIAVWPHGDNGASRDNTHTNLELGQIRTNNCGYCINPTTVHGLQAVLDTELTGRSVIAFECAAMDIKVSSKNHQASADVIMATTAGFGMNGVNIDYTNIQGTDGNISNKCVVLEIGDAELFSGVHRNINIKLNIKSDGTAFRGFGFQMRKLLSNGTVANTDNNHVIDGVTVTGQIDAGGGPQESIAFGQGTWGTGDTIKNVRWRDLSLDGNQPAIFPQDSLKDTMILDNVSYSSTINITTNANFKTVVTGCTAANFTGATTDTDLVDYISCNITDGSTQALAENNKTFVNTLVGSTVFGGGSTWTPTITSLANVDSTAAFACNFMMQGKVVTCSGKVDINPTTTATLTRIGISLPIASDIVATEMLAGSAFNIAQEAGPIFGNIASDFAEFNYTPTGTTLENVFFTFTYRVGL